MKKNANEREANSVNDERLPNMPFYRIKTRFSAYLHVSPLGASRCDSLLSDGNHLRY